MSILHVVETWHPYFKTNHHILKYFLEKWLSSIDKCNILGMIMRSYIRRVKRMLWLIFYLDNSRRIGHSFPYHHQFWDGSRRLGGQPKNNNVIQLIQWIQIDPNQIKIYTWKQDTLWYKGNIVLEKYLSLKKHVLEDLNSSVIAGHSRFHKTYEINKLSFF